MTGTFLISAGSFKFLAAIDDKMMDFHDIQVWQKAYDLTLKVYKSTESFPKHAGKYKVS